MWLRRSGGCDGVNLKRIVPVELEKFPDLMAGDAERKRSDN
jgi:hypothetical protein